MDTQVSCQFETFLNDVSMHEYGHLNALIGSTKKSYEILELNFSLILTKGAYSHSTTVFYCMHGVVDRETGVVTLLLRLGGFGGGVSSEAFSSS